MVIDALTVGARDPLRAAGVWRDRSKIL